MSLLSFHCFYEDNATPTRHYQELDIKDIPKWIKAYQFTHPNVQAITVKVWLKSQTERSESECVEM